MGISSIETQTTNNLLHTAPRWAVIVTLSLYYGVANAEKDICSQHARDIRFDFGVERYKRKYEESLSRQPTGFQHSNHLLSFQSLVNMSSPSEQIAAHPFFTADVSALPFDERIALSYQRAILILRTYSTLPATMSLF